MESPDAQHETDEPTATTPRRRRFGGRRIAAALVLLVASVVAFLPALAGSALGRPILLDYVNRQLNGRAEIRQCSLGWFHGITVDGLVVFDETDRQILQASHVTSGLRFLNLLKGKFRCGAVHADDMDVLISRGPDGSTNWDRLVRSDSSWRSPEVRDLPSGELSVSRGSCTYEDQSGQPPVFLRAMTLYLNAPGGDHLMADGLSADARIGNLTSGSVRLAGGVRVHDGGTMRVIQQLITNGLDPSIVSQRLGPAWRLVKRTDGEAMFVTERAEHATITSESKPSDAQSK